MQLATPAGDAAKIDINAVVKKLKEWEESNAETDIQRSVDVKLRKLFCESYSIVRKGNGAATAKKNYKTLRESLEAVNTGLVLVYDLENSLADFKLELLKCALKSFDSCSDSQKAACYKLKYTLKARDDLVPEQMKEVLIEGVLNGFPHDCA
jgi:hypothetical protein